MDFLFEAIAHIVQSGRLSQGSRATTCGTLREWYTARSAGYVPFTQLLNHLLCKGSILQSRELVVDVRLVSVFEDIVQLSDGESDGESSGRRGN